MIVMTDGLCISVSGRNDIMLESTGFESSFLSLQLSLKVWGCFTEIDIFMMLKE